MLAKLFRNYLFAGLIVWLPIVVTFFVLRFIVEILDMTMSLVPAAYQPEHLLGVRLPGLGVIFSLLLLIITGIVVTNFLGQRLFTWGESLLVRIPLVSSIYNAVKQVIQAVFASNSQAFRKVLLIEYPRQGMWSLAFLTGSNTRFAPLGSELVTVFVPTTPNPTSGFLLMLPRDSTTDVDMSVDEALKFIISLGVMQATPEIKKAL